MLMGKRESFDNEFNDGDTQMLFERVFKHYLANTFRSLKKLWKENFLFLFTLMKFLYSMTRMVHQSLPRSTLLDAIKLKIYGT